MAETKEALRVWDSGESDNVVVRGESFPFGRMLGAKSSLELRSEVNDWSRPEHSQSVLHEIKFPDDSDAPELVLGGMGAWITPGLFEPDRILASVFRGRRRSDPLPLRTSLGSLHYDESLRVWFHTNEDPNRYGGTSLIAIPGTSNGQVETKKASRSAHGWDYKARYLAAFNKDTNKDKIENSNDLVKHKDLGYVVKCAYDRLADYRLPSLSLYGLIKSPVIPIQRSMRIAAEECGVVDPAVPLGYTRIWWTTKTGYCSYSDYKVEAANDLNRILTTIQARSHVESANASPGHRSLFQTISATISRKFLNFRLIKLGQSRNPLIPLSQTSATPLEPLSSRPIYLLYCVLGRQKVPPLHQADIKEIANDGQLFVQLRKEYRRHCGDHRFTLYILQGIHFVRFTLRKQMLLDCIERNDLRPRSKWHQYSFDPREPEDKPPFTAEYLKVLFYTLEAEDDSFDVPKQLPKKLYTELQYSQDVKENRGWGIQFEQSLNVSLILWIVFIFLLVLTVTFGVLYAYFEKDVGDAFTVSGFIATLAAVALQIWAFAEVFPGKVKA